MDNSSMAFRLIPRSTTVGFHAPARASIALSNGDRLDFDIRFSRRKSVGLRVCADGLIVNAPLRMPVKLIVELVGSKARWIEKRLAQAEAAMRQLDGAASARPDILELSALGERWRIEYRATDSKSIRVGVAGADGLVLSGAVENVDACRTALRRWLLRHAKKHLVSWLTRVSRETRLTFSSVSIKNQRTRWGSCTRYGRINLNCKLLFFPPELVRSVLVHELCHTVEHNHSARFWALVQRFEPDNALLRRRMREAWRWVPHWV
jgi:predicted metal-dependent hydrolase